MAKKPDTTKPMTAIQLALAETFLKPFETPQQMRDWIYNFFDIDFPMGRVDPDSNTSPVEWMFEVYTAMRNNEGNEKPVYVVYSARDAYKTLGCSALEVILMVHLNATVAHMAAITSQSAKAIQYINSFVRKIEPYLEHHGGAVTSKNVRNISIKNANGDEVYVQVIVATLQGSNSNHTLFFACDEVDVVQYPQAFEEAKMIPGVQNGKFPITLYTSTRKFAFGLMQKEIERAQENGHPIRHWNILDVTEHCSSKRNKKDQGTVKRYIAKNLPLLQISPEEHLSLPEEKRDGYEAIEAYVGCVDCKLLPVCKTRLANRPENDRGGLWKPIDFTINQFSKIEPDMAEAQLLCFTESAQILMSDGTCKPISEIKINDLVITHTGEIQPVTEVFVRFSDSEMIDACSYNWNGFDKTLITPEHPFLLNGNEWRSIESAKISKFNKAGSPISIGDYTSFPVNYEVTGKGYIDFIKDIDANVPLDEYGKLKSETIGRNIPSTYECNYDFGWILGFYLAEGFLSYRAYGKNDKTVSSVTFCTHSKELEYHEKIRNFAKSIGLTTVDQFSKKGLGYIQTLYSKNLGKMLLSLCGKISYNKKISPILMQENLTFLRGIFEGFYAGDGTKRYESRMELTTVSYALACQLYLICGRLGLTPTITKQQYKNNRRPVYRIRVANDLFKFSQNRTRFRKDEKYNQYRVKSLDSSFYSGHVYNLEVAKNHSYIANGVAVHNCWKPSSTGLVYPRFDQTEGENTITVSNAYYQLMGDEKPDVTLPELILKMSELGIQFYVGGDWGFRHNFALIVGAILPSGDFWIVECFVMAGLEFPEMMKYSEYIRDKYMPRKWFMDTAQPMFIKSFKKAGMPCKEFKKDVSGGISSIRGQIIDASGRRRLKVLLTEENRHIIKGFHSHHFRTDAAGNITAEPDDENHADALDSLRYMGQNLFATKGGLVAPDLREREQEILKNRSSLPQFQPDPGQRNYFNEIFEMASNEVDSKGKGKSATGSVFWDFSND
jgi:hypothetical protein